MEEPQASQEVEDQLSEPSDEDASEEVPTTGGEDSPLPEGRETAHDEGGSDAGGSAEDRPRRSLKVVVTLEPSDGTVFEALFALGADGCDPIFHAREVADLAAGMAELPGLIVRADDRWANQPRYPAASPPQAGRAAPARAATAPGRAPVETPPTAVQPGNAPAPSDQLAPFG